MSEQIERQMDNYSDAELIKLRDSVLDLANRIEKRIAIPPKNAWHSIGVVLDSYSGRKLGTGRNSATVNTQE